MLEPVKVDYRASGKNVLKSILKTIAPLAVFALVVGIFFVVQTHRERREQAIVRAAVLYDLDYLLATLEQNLPTLGIIYRRHGVDMLTLGQEFRNTVESPATDIDYMLFWQLLRRDFFGPARGISHLNSLTEGMRLWLLEAYSSGVHLGGLPTLERYVEILSVPPLFYVDMPIGWPNAHIQENVTFDIIEENRIAHLRIRTFNWIDSSHIQAMFHLRRFIYMAQEYVHLIIDLRSNTGGSTHFFHSHFGSQLVAEPHTVYIHNFYKAGSHNMEFMNSMADMRPQSMPIDIDYFRAFLAPQYLHVLYDIMRMDYYYVYAHTLQPSELQTQFNGKIWMLVDENMFSAAQWVATFYKEIGFATLVGNTTGGGLAFCSVAMFSNYITLPNTGIIVRYDTMLSLDPRGRPIEYGTEPHYFNRPGMDALETVLALIEEGWYSVGTRHCKSRNYRANS